ncbi:hypothetical protein M9Y10_031500 [Tritrichomonas musculus]|uniref:Protein kinase domain-containing protein n=1 Tax=Tritrichomonas musculus TaxID=1915356 RepID=A0ABR2H2H7_9EUKA
MIEAELEHIQEILINHGYKYKGFLGSGSFSQVFLCESQKYHQQFAVKRAAKQKISLSEYDTLISLNHPNIIRLYDAFEEEDWQYLIMEYCPNGTIRKKVNLSYDSFIFFARQMLEALFYCHSLQIAHRDIKPDNIFFDNYDHIKLADFGLSKKFDSNSKSTEKCGSLIFFAPEMFQLKEIDPFQADIWALGITFFYLVTGTYPFKTNSHEELKKWVIYGDLDFSGHIVDPQIRFLISKMTNKSPKVRYTAEKLLKLPMFSQSISKKKSPLFNGYVKKNMFTTGYNADLIKYNNLEQNIYKSAEDPKKQECQSYILSYRNIVQYPNKQRIGIRNLTKPI